MDKDCELTSCQRDYLALIQGVINRMAASSVAIKGFAATIFAGVLAIVVSSGTSCYWLALVIAAISIAVAFFFDWYYFYQEKQYRRLYEDVREGSHECNFVMSAPKYENITRCSTLRSFALWLYYGLLEILLLLAGIIAYNSII